MIWKDDGTKPTTGQANSNFVEKIYPPPSFFVLGLPRQAQRLTGGNALGGLEANPQLNCYLLVVLWQVPQPPKPGF
jgi:hypothetical protein